MNTSTEEYIYSLSAKHFHPFLCNARCVRLHLIYRSQFNYADLPRHGKALGTL